MTLDDYLNGPNDTAAALAARVGISAASMSRIRKGGQNISLTLADKIVRETGGKVTFDALVKARAA